MDGQNEVGEYHEMDTDQAEDRPGLRLAGIALLNGLYIQVKAVAVDVQAGALLQEGVVLLAHLLQESRRDMEQPDRVLPFGIARPIEIYP